MSHFSKNNYRVISAGAGVIRNVVDEKIVRSRTSQGAMIVHNKRTKHVIKVGGVLKDRLGNTYEA